MQRMGSFPILRVNINVPVDAMLKFDGNADENIDVDAKCEQTLYTNMNMKLLFFAISRHLYQFMTQT